MPFQQKAAAETEKITGGSLDYLIANAAYITQWDAYDGFAVLGPKNEELDHVFHEAMDTNVLGNIHLYTLFMPQILKGKGKKVILISSGMGDMEWTRNYELETGALYSATKAAMNLIQAKFHAQYKKDGVLFLSICPGMVDTGVFGNSKSSNRPQGTRALC
jgi:NAD(P)-dependent dehydrogenase (short-subunit alcohol dehydrogenase family)